MKKTLLLLLAVVAVVLLSGCGPMFLKAEVSTFQTISNKRPTFAIVPYKEQEGNLEFLTYAGSIRENLIARGFREAPQDSADVALFVQYSMDGGRQETYTYPIFGNVPTGNSYTYGTVNTYGNTSYLSATTTQQQSIEVVGTGVGSARVFHRELRLTMIDVRATKAAGVAKPVYETTVKSDGRIGNLTSVMPFLIRAMFEEFPARNGSVRTANVPII